MLAQSTKVFVNGVWLGIHRNPQELVSTLRRMRRQVLPALFLQRYLSLSLACLPA